jgi:transposase-like protein
MSKRNRSAKANASNGNITNMVEFFRRFGTEEQCEEHLFHKLYPKGFHCPKCGNVHCAKIRNRREYQCSHCAFQFSLTTGTIMENTKLPLSKWFLATFLITRDKRGISGMQLARELEVTDRTACFLLQRIRSSMAAEECLHRAFM